MDTKRNILEMTLGRASHSLRDWIPVSLTFHFLWSNHVIQTWFYSLKTSTWAAFVYSNTLVTTWLGLSEIGLNGPCNCMHSWIKIQSLCFYLFSSDTSQSSSICILNISYYYSILVTKCRSCMILQYNTRPPLTGCSQQRNGKHVWMKHCGRQRSAGCSVWWPPNDCPRTGEWTVLAACTRKLQVRKNKA